ncbi:MAG: hypothetical protein JNK49_19125 [Planctomycetes bacterium]|nr:hypothetical protein [Planctomycetota bacterium]
MPIPFVRGVVSLALFGLAWSASIAPSCAQEKPAAAASGFAAQEQQLAQRAVGLLHGAAEAFAAARQHARAVALRRELLREYAHQDPKALTALGYVQKGDQWLPDPNQLVPDQDFAGDKKLLRAADTLWTAAQKELGAAHRALALAASKSGALGPAMRHWRRVQRFLPKDAAAAAALAEHSFEGFGGSAAELAMLGRARVLRDACDFLRQWPAAVTAVGPGTQPLLQRAGITHRSCRSEHFAVAGTLPDEQLSAVAQWAERAYFLSFTLFGVPNGVPFRPQRVRSLVLVADPATYGRVLDGCRDQFDAARLEFLKTQVDLAYLDVDGESVRFLKTKGGLDEALDQAVRGVVQDAAGLTSEGLWEGLGHAACAFLFDRTLTFLLEQERGPTSAGGRSELLKPDMATWRALAERSAFSASDTRSSELVLVHAARFRSEQRVKAWALCDYLCHTGPEQLFALDAAARQERATPPLVETHFAAATGRELATLDAEWRAFYAQQADLRAAMVADPLGEATAKDRKQRELARRCLFALSAQRVAAGTGPLGGQWSERGPLVAALAYAASRHAAEAKAAQDPKVVQPLPEPPAELGTQVLLARGSKPEAAVAGWWLRPVWRDALLHPGRGLLGLRAADGACAVALQPPEFAVRSGPPRTWPRAGQTAVPGAVRADQLGPRAQAALARAGIGSDSLVGVPLTLHCHRELPVGELRSVRAEVYVGNHQVDGVLVVYGDELDAVGAPDQAPGLVAFVPLQPLPANTVCEARWTPPPSLLERKVPFPAVAFTTQ